MENYAEFFTKYFDFKGRTTRKVYWLTWLFLWIIGLVFDALDSSALTIVWALATIIPRLAITTRRLHDANKSGKIILWNNIVGIISAILLWAVIFKLFVAGIITENLEIAENFDENEIKNFFSSNSVVLLGGCVFALASLVMSIITFIFSLLPSVNENNKYAELIENK